MPNSSPKQNASVSITRMSSQDTIRLRVELAAQIVDLDLTPHDFALALTGRSETPATVVRVLSRT